MSLFITYQVNDKQHCMQMPFDEYFDILVKNYHQECDVIWGLTENIQDVVNPQPKSVSKKELIETISKLLSSVKNDSKFRQSNYFFCLDKLHKKAKGQMAKGFRFSDRGGCYAIKSGIGFCTMTKEVLSPDGKSLLFIEPEDLREVHFLETTNMGTVRIIKEQKPTVLVNQIKRLQKFLEKCDGEIVVKSLK